MAKHTPGPWVHPESEGHFHNNRVWTEDRRPIVSLLSMGQSPADVDPEAQANGDLIAAATDMLRELKALVAWDDDGAGDFGKLYFLMDRVRHTIAKAEGRK